MQCRRYQASSYRGGDEERALMKGRTMLGWSALCGWIALPWLLWWAAHGLDNVVWFTLHQLYYLPLGSWMREPFFRPDSEVMFFVLPAGRLLTVLLYLAVAVALTLSRRARRRRRT